MEGTRRYPHLLAPACVLVLCTAGPAAVAETDPVPRPAYVALALGTSNLIDDDRFDDLDVEEFDFGWSLYGGYHLLRYFALEAGYTDFGTFRASNKVASTTEKFSTLYLAGVGTLLLQRNWALYGKLGVAALRQEQSFSLLPDETQTNAGFLLGIGTHWSPQALERWAFAVSYDSYSFETEQGDENFWNSVGLTAIGARFMF